MDNSFYDRLLVEAQELATKTNALNDFMRTQKFVDLDRENKDLLYKQSRLMNEYLQILGQRLELLGDKFSFKKTELAHCLQLFVTTRLLPNKEA